MTRDSIDNPFLRPLPCQAQSPPCPFDMRNNHHTPSRREHTDSIETYADDRDNGSPQLLQMFPLVKLDSLVLRKRMMTSPPFLMPGHSCGLVDKWISPLSLSSPSSIYQAHSYPTYLPSPSPQHHLQPSHLPSQPLPVLTLQVLINCWSF